MNRPPGNEVSPSPKAEANSQVIAATNTIVSQVDRPRRATRVYRVTGTRINERGPETISLIRRNLPAAQRAARKLEDQGRGPVRIDVATVTTWTEVTS